MTPEELASRLYQDAHLLYGVFEQLDSLGQCPPGLDWLKEYAQQQVQFRSQRIPPRTDLMDVEEEAEEEEAEEEEGQEEQGDEWHQEPHHQNPTGRQHRVRAPGYNLECNRGAAPLPLVRSRYHVRMQPQVNISENVHALIAQLAAADWDSPIHDVPDWVQQIASSLTPTPNIAGTDTGLAAIVKRCVSLSGRGVRMSFLLMVNLIHLVTKCQNMRVGTPGGLSDIYKDMDLGVHERTFKQWIAWGTNFAAIAGGGTIYVLILIAGLNLRVSLAHFDGATAIAIGNVLRNPPDESLQKLIKERIAPTIHHLKAAFPLSMAMLFPVDELSYHLPIAQFDCSDITASDRFFNSLNFSTIPLIAREPIVWASHNPLPVHIAPTPTLQLMPDEFNHSTGQHVPLIIDRHSCTPKVPIIQHVVIRTAYNRQDPENLKLKAKRENTEVTEKERVWAERAVPVTDIRDLKAKLSRLYSGGRKRSSGSYVRLDMEVIPNTHLDIRNSDGSLMVFISTALPNRMRDILEQNLLASMENITLLHDQAGSHEEDDADDDDERQGRFGALHLSWYNRHCTQGHDAPSGVHPWLLEKVDGTPFNHHQTQPYLSKEAVKFRLQFNTIKVAFEEVFQWIEEVLREYLPEEYKILEVLASSLPGNCHPVAFPFIAIVININASSRMHRDGMDHNFCLVMAIGSFTGGALAMLETGLVLPIRQGDIAVFRSGDITHFNLVYEGKRASIVLHSDKMMTNWLRDQNGWGPGEVDSS